MKQKNEITTKIVLMLMIAIAMAAALAFSASAQLSKFPQIKVTLINQEPDPVSPGNTVDLRFRIENEGSSAAPNVEIKLVLTYPFSFYGSEQEIKNIGTLTGNQVGDIGVQEKWKLLVDSGAATGDNVIEFWYRIDQGTWTKVDDFMISVKSREAVLAINQVKTDQESIVPGTKTKVSFVVENLADNTLMDIKLNLEILTVLSSATGVTVRELPFTPIGSGNDKTVKTLSPGQTAEISFDLFTDATAESKVYKVPYTLTYSDSSGTNFTKQGIVGLLVESAPDLTVNIDKTEIYSAGSKGLVEFKLVNKGFSDIKFLDVKLNANKDFEILSNPEVYIGKLDSDDYETADYTLMVSKTAKDQVILPLHVEYRDANGGLYTKDLNLNLKLFSGAELKQRTNGKGSSAVVWIVLIVVIVAGVFIYRKIRKNKRKKEQK
jgi:hypothetical protein